MVEYTISVQFCFMSQIHAFRSTTVGAFVDTTGISDRDGNGLGDVGSVGRSDNEDIVGSFEKEGAGRGELGLTPEEYDEEVGGLIGESGVGDVLIVGFVAPSSISIGSPLPFSDIPIAVPRLSG